MRLKLSLANKDILTIPINYQYPLMSSIIHILKISSSEYSEFIHTLGYLGTDGKRRKLFTYSKLYFSPAPLVKNGSLIIHPYSQGVLYISSPMLNDFLTNLIIGASKDKNLLINDSEFIITSIEALPQPDLIKISRFKTLSPITLATVREYKGKRGTYYYRPLDDELPKAVKKSLIGKYKSIFNTYPNDDHVSFGIDTNYIRERGGENAVSKLIKIKENQNDQTNIKAFECPFYLTGSSELIQVAWDCGIGDKTNMGFGCISI